MSKIKFEIVLLRNVIEFFDEIDPKAHKKILYNIEKAQKVLDPKLFKKIDAVFWEFRAEHRGLQYRVLAFWDKRDNDLTLVITTHGFIKKSQKLPGNELDRAYLIRHRYLNNEEK